MLADKFPLLEMIVVLSFDFSIIANIALSQKYLTYWVFWDQVFIAQ